MTNPKTAVMTDRMRNRNETNAIKVLARTLERIGLAYSLRPSKPYLLLGHLFSD